MSVDLQRRTGESDAAWGESERRHFLGTCWLGHSLPAPVLDELAAALQPRTWQRGEIIFREADPAQRAYVLAEGRIKFVQETDDGQEVILHLFHSGEIFGVEGLWADQDYRATAVAIDRVTVLGVSVPMLMALLAREPSLTLAFFRLLGQRLRDAEARVRDLQTEQVEGRIARAVIRLVSRMGRKTSEGIDVGVRLTRQDLAELSGTTLSTASRTLSAWSKDGIIRTRREQVIITDPHRLIAIADNLPVLATGLPRPGPGDLFGLISSVNTE